MLNKILGIVHKCVETVLFVFAAWFVSRQALFSSIEVTEIATNKMTYTFNNVERVLVPVFDIFVVGFVIKSVRTLTRLSK